MVQKAVIGVVASLSALVFLMVAIVGWRVFCARDTRPPGSKGVDLLPVKARPPVRESGPGVGLYPPA